MRKEEVRIFGLAILLAAALSPASAQKLDPVQWTLSSDSQKAAPGSSVTLKLTAKLDENWHLYSLTTPKGGPIPTTAGLAENPAVAGFKLYQPKPARKFDPNFNLDTETFEKEAVFWIVADLKKDAATGPLELTAQVRYQACDDRQCLPPRKKTASLTLAVDPSAPPAAGFVRSPEYTEIGAATPAASAAPATAKTDDNMLSFLLTAFGFGLATIFTPCVFPMIPITVSFFLGQRGGIVQALVFCLGIIVLFCALGFGVSAAVGPFGVVQLASNPWVNGFIALIFGAFALSLLGAFEITLPSSLLTKLDAASRRGGYLGTLLMGLTFSLTSFACVGPFLGTILAASVQQKGAQPVLGMASFATGLASPFFFLAAFPSYLKKLPRSGGWLARVKVVMGFAVLAFMLKYASNVDLVLQTNWITRERFLAAWFVLFAMAGLYLLGLLRLEGIEPGDALGIGRLLTASAILIFAFSLLPGMFGVPLGELDAFIPVATSSPGRASAEAGQTWMKNQYREALDQARQQNKLVLVSFTGYACTNCHWMKANMWPRPEIAEAMKDLVLVELYTDGTDKASEENQKLEDQRFQTVAIPYYAILDPDGKVLATLPGRSTNAQEVLAFVKTRSNPS
ncbi:MAG TPA: cytochrome c biogenesis protein CcdA [Bryobacteraceae bacterium]|nr:cytochrome c biogenesis protein CcdA [Bryobacteraceae bacterium]